MSDRPIIFGEEPQPESEPAKALPVVAAPVTLPSQHGVILNGYGEKIGEVTSVTTEFSVDSLATATITVFLTDPSALMKLVNHKYV